jgi:cell division protein FtsW (lipid II flippase)
MKKAQEKKGDEGRMPGDVLHAIAARLFEASAVERVLTPTLSDMQAEWALAMAEHRPWRARAKRFFGFIHFLRAAVAVAAIGAPRRMGQVPFRIVVPPLLLAGLGVAVLRSAIAASPQAALEAAGAAAGFPMRQAAYLGIGAALMLLAAVMPRRWLSASPWLWAGLGVAAIASVAAFGVDYEGATRWVRVGGLLLQPGELAKPLFFLAIAGALAAAPSKLEELDPARGAIGAIGIGAVSVAALALQPDPGLAAVYLAALGAMALAWTGKPLYRAALALTCAAAIPAVYSIGGSHGVAEAARAPEALRSAMTAGGFVGGALGGSRTPIDLASMPDLHTDFILGVVAERAGILGAAALAGLMAASIIAMLTLARKAEDPLTKLLCAGVSGAWIGQTLLHGLSAAGVIPRTGLPLPLLSYGGSSLIALLVSVGLCANLCAERRRAELSLHRLADPL